MEIAVFYYLFCPCFSLHRIKYLMASLKSILDTRQLKWLPAETVAIMGHMKIAPSFLNRRNSKSTVLQEKHFKVILF